MYYIARRPRSPCHCLPEKSAAQLISVDILFVRRRHSRDYLAAATTTFRRVPWRRGPCNRSRARLVHKPRATPLPPPPPSSAISRGRGRLFASPFSGPILNASARRLNCAAQSRWAITYISYIWKAHNTRIAQMQGGNICMYKIYRYISHNQIMCYLLY